MAGMEVAIERIGAETASCLGYQGRALKGMSAGVRRREGCLNRGGGGVTGGRLTLREPSKHPSKREKIIRLCGEAYPSPSTGHTTENK